jgi:hypothetical protein
MNKIPKKNKQSGKHPSMKDEKSILKYGEYYLPASIFILSGIYFYLFGSYIFFYQEQLSLFIFTSDFLKQFTSKPGGLLEFASNFISQGYFSKLYGTLILSAVFALIVVVFLKINRKISPGNLFSSLLAVLVSCFLILIQTNINYLMHNNLGLLSAGLYFLFSISSDKKPRQILILSIFPLFFYIAGAYAWIFLGMFIIYNLANKKVTYPVVLLIIAGLSVLLFKEIIFLQPWSGLLYYPMPLKGFFSSPVIIWLLLLFFIFYPAFLILTGSVKMGKAFSRFFPTYSPLFGILLTIVVLSKRYNKEAAGLFSLEKMFFTGNWSGVIEQQKKDQSRNLVAQYYYNTALAESGQLCDRLFLAPQDYGSMSISIPWNSEIPIIQMFRGVYFYYSIGLINEAHRWAFESMVIQGYRPENIKLLIKTDLINGHYKIAEKYIYVLKRTLHYRKLAKKYELMLSDPELIKSDPELGEKIRIKPDDDFIIRIRNPHKNISSLLQSNPYNKKAFEYEIARLMLDRDVDGIIDLMKRFGNINYSRTPRYIEEAILFIRSNILTPHPEFDMLKISSETESRFSRYISYLMETERTKSRNVPEITDELRNTFWYYLDSK